MLSEDIKMLKDKECMWKNPELRILEAHENVLNRLQELEQIEKAHKDIVGELTIRNDELNKAIGKEYQLGHAQGEYEVNEYWKSKIREKIEELDNMIEEISKGNLQKYTVGEIIVFKKILRDLLEENK